MNPPTPEISLSAAVIALMKGVTHRDADAQLWQTLLSVQGRVREYVEVLGLELTLDEAEGYAYLRQRPIADGELGPGRLIPRRQLGYHVSLLLVVLRKKLAEFDAKSSDVRLVLRGEEIVDLVRVLLPHSVNEARFLDRMETHINKVVELGFLRKLRGEGDQYEVQRILKAFVDAQWLGNFEHRLAQYREHALAVQSDLTEGKP